MGCVYSSCEASRPPPDCVRVIHITGESQDLAAPVTAGELTGRPPKKVLFSSAHLAGFGSNSLRPDDLLEPGGIYFLLPHGVLRSESSAVDVATLMARLLAVSKKGGAPAPKPPCRPRAPSWKPKLDPIDERPEKLA